MYPADVMKMLDEEAGGPSTSAAGGRELVPVPSPTEPREDRPEAAAAVTLSSDGSVDAGVSLSGGGADIPPSGGGN